MISSDRLEMDEAKQLAVFSGRVEAVEGEMRLTARRMTVRYLPAENGRNKRELIQEIYAQGDVTLKQGDTEGNASEARYQVGQRRLEMIGKSEPASVRFGKDHVRGARIKVTLNANRQVKNVRVDGGATGGRVTMKIIPGQERAGAGDQQP
ncbi:putative OstA family protein [Magnetofaba australis IT-1]|uniref:Putative OstA family protein n=1 Tax=Magnetofaba australis IT-1 TaxID=1434232 RepID=A0A1Y2K102_9PROT|nr:putative OstA family protein [Magnetofaba australis IT-1]